MSLGLPQVYKTTISQQNDVATISHGVAVNLGLDVRNRLGVFLEPCNVYFNVEVANAVKQLNIGLCKGT